MRSRWPPGMGFTRRVLTVEQYDCAACGRALTICDHRFHRVLTLGGPLELVRKQRTVTPAVYRSHGATAPSGYPTQPRRGVLEEAGGTPDRPT
jgi:hypothetical protein